MWCTPRRRSHHLQLQHYFKLAAPSAFPPDAEAFLEAPGSSTQQQLQALSEIEDELDALECLDPTPCGPATALHAAWRAAHALRVLCERASSLLHPHHVVLMRANMAAAKAWREVLLVTQVWIGCGKEVWCGCGVWGGSAMKSGARYGWFYMCARGVVWVWECHEVRHRMQMVTQVWMCGVAWAWHGCGGAIKPDAECCWSCTCGRGGRGGERCGVGMEGLGGERTRGEVIQTAARHAILMPAGYSGTVIRTVMRTVMRTVEQ